MEDDKRLDFDAPFLSVRRFSAPPPDSELAGGTPARRSSLPFYKSDLKTGPLRNPGVIPFVWEQTPGRPKEALSGLGGARTRPIGRPPSSLNPLLDGGSHRPRAENHLIPSVRTRKPEFVPVPSETPGKTGDEEVKKEETLSVDCSDDDEDDFSDAAETLSWTDSVFMNCSMSGQSGAPDSSAGPSGSYATDPQVRDFMMGRFLPAAVAASSPLCAPRKPPVNRCEARDREDDGDYRRPARPAYQYGANFIPQYAREREEEADSYIDEEDYEGTSPFSSKACGLLPHFLLKSSFCLLNPVSRMKVQGLHPPPRGKRITSPQIKASNPQSLHQADDEHSWEAVYMHKLGHGDQQKWEDGSKLTSESNHLTYSSDSQTPDGSSPYRPSVGGSISPYRNETPRSPFHEGKGFLGVPKRRTKICRANELDSGEKDVENCSQITPHDDSQQGSGSMSPVMEKILPVDTETPDSKTSCGDSNSELKVVPHVSGSELGVVSRTTEDSLVLETSRIDTSQPKVSELVQPGLLLCSGTSGDNDLKGDNCDGALRFKVKDDASLPPLLLPPPLPKSPSDSWLSRKLPFVSSRNPPQKSVLGVQVHQRKQILLSSTDLKRENDGKSVKAHRQIRFAEMLTKPMSPETEI